MLHAVIDDDLNAIGARMPTALRADIRQAFYLAAELGRIDVITLMLPDPRVCIYLDEAYRRASPGVKEVMENASEMDKLWLHAVK